VPITVLFCDTCGEWVYDEALRDRVFELFCKSGADAWFDLDAKDFLPEGYKCPKCGGGSFTKETDILDVWFDSGSSFAAVMEDRDYLPDRADMYLEGSDQHRGWFHSSLLISVASRNGVPPYREVLTHGYVVDGAGKKMSKSLGNTIEPEKLVSKYGADVLRLWVASENYQDDVRVSDEIFGMLVKAYFTFRNTCRFMLGNLSDFDPEKDAVPLKDISDPIDRHALKELSVLTGHVRRAYAAYAFHEVYHRVNNFMGSLSSFYLDVLKDRLYTFRKGDPLRRGSQTVIRRILESVTALMAPILSFTAEEIHRHLNGLPQAGSPEADSAADLLASGKTGAGEGADINSPAQSVFLTLFPQPDPELESDPKAADMERLLVVRASVNKALEEARKAKVIGSALDAAVGLKASGETLELLKAYEARLPELFIVSGVTLSELASAPKASADPSPESAEAAVEVTVTLSPDHKCPRCWNRRPEVPEDGSAVCDKCKRALEG
jgi:isoleucyl-tRNA synthetase